MYYVIYGLQFNKKQLPLIAHTIITIISLFANSFLYFVYLSRYFSYMLQTLILIALHQCQRLLTFPNSSVFYYYNFRGYRQKPNTCIRQPAHPHLLMKSLKRLEYLYSPLLSTQNASVSGIDSMNSIPSSSDMLKTAVDNASAIPESLQTIETDL